MIYWTADTHFFHTKIIHYTNRPFSTVEEMNDVLINNINRVVSPSDTLYHLGDFAWRNAECIQNMRRAIICNNIHLIYGNHDRVIRHNKNLQRLFTSVGDITEVLLSHQRRIVLCHYGMRTWNAKFHGAWHLYGHSHDTLPEDDSLSFDVGVDCPEWNYTPISLDQIVSKMERKIENVSQAR